MASRDWVTYGSSGSEIEPKFKAVAGDYDGLIVTDYGDVCDPHGNYLFGIPERCDTRALVQSHIATMLVSIYGSNYVEGEE